MSDIAAWLEGIGLGKHARLFEDHDIDLQALRHLTAGMLEQLGLPIGARIRLLAAIAELPSLRPPPTDGTSPDPTSTKQVTQHDTAERRQLTVLFCDMVDSTELARRLDPEDLRTVMGTYQATCREVIARFEGHVAQYLGDGIVAYFGWPTALEDAAERAIRAGVEIVQSIRNAKLLEPLSVRVGISTGIVVIGETGLGDASSPAGAVGDTPYVASRLQALAPPHSVLIANATRRLISDRFELEALGPQLLKGVDETIDVFRVRRVHEDSSRFQAARTNTLTPLIGRQAELALLRQRWRDARDSEGQVVFVSGIPGIGKSRMAYEVEQSIEGDSHFSLRFQCLPHCMQSALFPVIQQIERLGDLSAQATNEGKIGRIRKLLSRAVEDSDAAVPFIAQMLSVPIGSLYSPPGLTAQQVKAQTLSILVDLILGLSKRRPVFCLLEDAQWIDPSTQELLDQLLARIEKARIFLLVTHRPEYHPRAGGQGHLSALAMPRLSRRDASGMVQLALAGHIVSSTVVARIIEESDSVPLYVEELARGVIEAGASTEIGAKERITNQSATWSVPSSLRDSLVARLDRAPQGRRVAQIAAVLGREFRYRMLHRVSSLTTADLDATLSHLERSDIIQKLDSGPTGRFVFKHALVRDAAYESLLKSSVRAIHARVATVIEEDWPDIVAGQPELLAYHFGLAGNAELAVRYWLLGGRRAKERSANVEAISQFQKALESLASLPETPQRNKTELETQLLLGQCFIAIRGYSSADTRRSFERACDLSARLEDPGKEVQATFGLWGHFWMTAGHDRAIALANLLLTKADELGDMAALAVAHRSLGSTLFTLGSFVEAKTHLELAIALARKAGTAGTPYVVDPGIAAQLMLAWDSWILGYPDLSLKHVQEALEGAIESKDPYSIAFAHYVTSAIYLLRREPQKSLASADRSLGLSREHGINLYQLYSRFGRGCALAEMGHEKPAIQEIRAGIEDAQRSHLEYLRAFMLGWLAWVKALGGDPDAALSTIDEALKYVNDISGRAWEAELYRLRGAILLKIPGHSVLAVEQSYRDAITVAQRQCARSLELRACTSLATLLRDQGRKGEALTLLDPCHSWFTEGFETPDLQEARSVLATLE